MSPSNAAVALFAAASIVSFRADAQPSRPPRALVGTWSLVSEELQRDGQWSPHRNRRGLLVHDALGHVIQIVADSGRRSFQAEQPTPDEARDAFNTYGGFFGTFSVAPGGSTVTYQHEGDIHPGLVGQVETVSYERSQDRLTLTSGGVRRTWQQVPDLAEVSSVQRELVGFWRWTAEERVTADGRVIGENKRSPSVIVYTPSGHVAVHFPWADRPQFAATATPTGSQLVGAVTRYVTYFGTVGVYPGNMLHHHLIAALNPSNAGDTYRRRLAVSGNTATLTFAPALFNGEIASQRVTVTRMSGFLDMSTSSSGR